MDFPSNPVTKQEFKEEIEKAKREVSQNLIELNDRIVVLEKRLGIR